MTNDRAMGSIHEFVGNVQQTFGKLIGNQAQQIRGLQWQVLGRAERALRDGGARPHQRPPQRQNRLPAS